MDDRKLETGVSIIRGLPLDKHSLSRSGKSKFESILGGIHCGSALPFRQSHFCRTFFLLLRGADDVNLSASFAASAYWQIIGGRPIAFSIACLINSSLPSATKLGANMNVGNIAMFPWFEYNCPKYAGEWDGVKCGVTGALKSGEPSSKFGTCLRCGRVVFRGLDARSKDRLVSTW